MTYDQVIAKLRKLSAQCVTKPDNDFAKMAESLQFHVTTAAQKAHGNTGLCCGLREQEKCRADIADSRLEAICEELEEVKHALEASQGEMSQIQHDVPTLHLRRCWACMTGKRGNDSPIFAVHWHADSVTPWVLCPVCGSQDTRKIKVHDLLPPEKPAPPSVVILREDQTVSRKKRWP